MANRVIGKAKKQAKKAPAPTAKTKAAPATSRDRVGELEAECQRLKAELAMAGKRMEALEAQRKLLLNRIDWAIDSLHSLLGD